MEAQQLQVTINSSIREAMAVLDKYGKGIAFIIEEDGRFVDTVTDGDIRRAILKSIKITQPLRKLIDNKGVHTPLTAHEDEDSEIVLAKMKERRVLQVPVLNSEGKIVSMLTREELTESDIDLQAVIMAGGFGTRLHPLTDDTPKPMLPVGDKPLIEHIVASLRNAGIKNLNITTHFMPEKIIDHFEDGSRFGVNVSYVNETTPLGTAGALSLMEEPTEPILVMNGDILTKIDFRALLAFHKEHQADMTICVRQYEFQVPYGVIECEGHNVRKLTEKPSYSFFVNAGIYLLEPKLHAKIPSDTKFDMTQLVDQVMVEGGTVASFPIIEYWMDIGQHADYRKANDDANAGQLDHAIPAAPATTGQNKLI